MRNLVSRPSDASQISLPSGSHSEVSLPTDEEEILAKPVPGSDEDDDADLPTSDEGEDLPTDDEEMDSLFCAPCLPSSPCCHRECFKKIDESLFQSWLEHRRTLKDEEVSDVVYQMLLACRRGGGKEKFCIMGIHTCQRAFLWLCRIGSHKLQRLVTHVAMGYVQAPRDLRHSRLVETGEATRVCKEFFHGLWLNSENLAEEEIDLPDTSSCEPVAVNVFSEWIVGPGTTVSYAESLNSDGREVRWRQTEAWVDIYEQMRAFCAESDLACPGYSTMLREYDDAWRGVLQFRPLGHQAKCPRCERFKAFRKLATSPEDHARVTRDYHAHLRLNKRNRAVQTHVNTLSERSVKGLIDRSSPDSCLSSTSDAIEQAKFRCPRHKHLAKDFSNLWRPQLKMIGGIMYGIAEYIFVMDPDVKKDANLEITLCALMQQHVHERLTADHQPMPACWSHQSDNAPGEGKNQIMAKYASWTVWKETFDTSELTQNMVGHTHGEIDQRHSEAGSMLNKHDTLEDPPEFLTALSKVTPRKGRQLVVKKIEASLDWASFFDNLGVTMSGHVQSAAMTKENEDACHMWRFVPRYKLDWKDTISTDWPEQPPHPKDIILLVKHEMSDTDLSQPPVVFCPNAFYERLPQGGPYIYITHKCMYVMQVTLQPFVYLCWGVTPLPPP